MAETNGQAGEGSQASAETTGAAPESGVTVAQTTGNGSGQPEEIFYDPESIKGKPELEALAKQLQGAYTKRRMADAEYLKSNKQKIDAYDSFQSNPVQSLQQLAGQLGYSLTKAEARQMLNEQDQNQPFEPKSWDEVFARAKAESKQEVLQELSPFLTQVKETRKGQIEKTLDESCPDWRVYEDQMMKTMAEHPSLVNDPVKLYRLSVPEEVFQSRATQAAIKKLQEKAQSSQLSAGSTTTKPAGFKPQGKMSFDQAVEYAKAQVASQGLKPPN